MHGWVILAAALGATTVAPDQVRERAAAVVARGGYQRDLPVEAATPVAEPAPHAETSPPPIRSPPPEPPSRALPSRGLPALPLQWIVIGGFAVLLIGAAVKLFGNWHRSPATPPAPDSTPSGRKASSSPAAALSSADQLARAGRFAEALHALLLQAIAELSRRREVAGSLTTRELLRSAAASLREDGRTALAELASAVENVHFGGRPARAEDYQQGLSAYRRFADACRS